MADSIGSLIGRAVSTACLSLLVCSAAHAQEVVAEPPTHAEFLAHHDFHISIASLGSSDERFSWDGHAGSTFDVVDYVYGRTTVIADYQVVMGSEFRAFDPNQGNYLLAVASSARVGPVELFGMFHHISRHLSDRPKRLAIAWNDIDAEALGRISTHGTTIDLRAIVGKIVAQAFVDYSWTGNLDILARHPFNDHVGLFARGIGNAIGIDPALSNRGRQTGGRAEAGVRFTGTSAAVEFFGGYERMIDADPFEQLPRSWAFGGFRIVNK
jgi:hypothetical protein